MSGWNQSEAARNLHISPGVVSRYMRDKTHPSETVLALFQTELQALQDTAGPSTRIHGMDRQNSAALLENSTRPPLDPWEQDLVDTLRRIAPPKRNQAAKAAQNLLELLVA